MADIQRSTTRVRGFTDAEMDFQLIRQMGSSAFGAASVGACLSTAGRIPPSSQKRRISDWKTCPPFQKRSSPGS
jgi:hypothetical protein